MSPSRFGAAVDVYDGRAYIVGGYGGSLLDRIDVFDGSTWDSAGNLPYALNFPAVSVVNGRLYVVGGVPNPAGETWSAVIRQDGKIDGWRKEATLLSNYATRLAVAGNCLYAIGGKNTSSQLFSQIYRAEWGNEGVILNWPLVNPLPRPLALHGVAVRGEFLYVFGGETTNGAFSDRLEVATINADCTLDWQQHATALPGGQPRARMAVASSDTGLYMIGGRIGSDSGGFVNDVCYDVLPPPPTPTPSMAVHKSATSSSPVDYNDPITYVIAYHNPWFQSQTGVVITDRIPAGTAWTNYAAPVPSSSEGEVLRWEFDELISETTGTIMFTVAVEPPDRDWDVIQTMQVITGGTARLPAQVSYIITYTLQSGTPARNGVLITDTLPASLSPLTMTRPSNTAYAVQGRDVIWRVMDAVDAGDTGRLQIIACISETISSTITLTNTVTLDDAYRRTTIIATDTLYVPFGSTILPSCLISSTVQLPSTDAPPLYPDVPVIRNQAWISSTQLEHWQSSNVVIHFWPTEHIYLPVIFRNF